MKLEMISNWKSDIQLQNGVDIERYIQEHPDGAVSIVYRIQGMNQSQAANLADHIEGKSFPSLQECLEVWEMMKLRVAKDVEAESRGWI